MENYESLGTIGEGTYGVVLKCRHKVTGQIVAIKKFKESDDDEQVKKTALREIKVLKQLKHENIVSLLEVFRVKGKLYLVFEFVEKTILEEIEKNPEGLDPAAIKRLMWQLVRAIHFCHQHNIIHRDIKPENLLVSRNGVLKLCDFGFARPLAAPGAKYTEYVSTRWYRAPELLVGDVSYGKAVDVWSIGCMFAEITTGLPLFPGDSDIDQLYHIIKCLGRITARQQELFRKNSLYVGVKLPHATELEPLHTRFPQLDKHSIDFLHQTIQDEPLDRWTCAELLKHPFFENLGDVFEAELQDAIARDLSDSAAIRKKRNRKSSRGNAGNGNGGVNSSLPSPTMSVKSSASAYDDPIALLDQQQAKNALKPSFKPIMAAVSYPSTFAAKDKTNSSSSVGVSSSKKGVGGGGALSQGTTGGGYHLPTLHGAMSNSSSTSSTSSGDTSPYSGGGYGKKLGVPTIAENQPITMGGGGAVPADHMEFINQHAQVRQSMTSHGGGRSMPAATGASTGLVHPYSFASGSIGGGGGAPKPPPTSYMRNPYLAQPPTTTSSHKRSNGQATHKNAASGQSGSMQTSSGIYSPKKFSSNSNSSQQSPHPQQSKRTGLDLTPQGIYVPPRTSHSTIRDPGSKSRSRETDGCSF
ncbi:hypothetical protein Gpo141_00007179 [Globisporangium polare]